MPRAVPEAGRLCVLGGGRAAAAGCVARVLGHVLWKMGVFNGKTSGTVGHQLKIRNVLSLSRFVPEEFWRGQTQSVSGAPAEDTEAQK